MLEPGLSYSLHGKTGGRKYLTSSERQAFITTSQHHTEAVASLCWTLAFTGCRISEALMVTGRAVDLAGGYIQLRTLKRRNGRVAARELPIPPALLDLLARQGCASPERLDKRLWPISRGRAWQIVKAVMREAGIQPGLHSTPKALRHSFGLHAVRSGVPITLVQRWLGHAQLRTTAIYLQAVGPEEREMAQKMWS